MLMKLRTLSVSLIFVMVFSLFPTRKVEAIPTSLQFGGLATFPIPCTCSGGFLIWFAPLWLGNVPTTGPLLYVGGLLYQGYLIGVPGAWHLGGYAPGGACFIIVPGGCIPLPAIGTIQYTGTSVPGPE